MRSIMVVIPISRWTNSLQGSRALTKSLLTSEEHHDLDAAFPASGACSISFIALVFWSAFISFGFGFYSFVKGVGFGFPIMIGSTGCMLVMAVWSSCMGKGWLDQACIKLEARHPRLTFRIEPYLVGAAFGRTVQHGVRIQARTGQLEGFQAPLIQP
jgi:hypothetical protein